MLLSSYGTRYGSQYEYHQTPGTVSIAVCLMNLNSAVLAMLLFLQHRLKGRAGVYLAVGEYWRQ